MRPCRKAYAHGIHDLRDPASDDFFLSVGQHRSGAECAVLAGRGLSKVVLREIALAMHPTANNAVRPRQGPARRISVTVIDL